MAVNYTSATYQAANPNTVHEVDGSPRESRERGKLTATVVLRVPWSLRYALQADILDGQIIYPRVAFPVALPTRCDIERVPGSETQGDDVTEGTIYDFANCTFTYTAPDNTGESPPDPPNAEIYYTEDWDDGIEMMPLNHKRYKWATAPNASLTPEETPSRQVATGILVQTLYDMAPSDTRIAGSRGLVGSTNDEDYTSLLYDISAVKGTLLCVGWAPRLTVKTDGSMYITVSTTFQYRADGWNKFWRQDIDAFDELVKKGDDTVIELYPEADFSGGMIGTFTP